jgi:hypothetical protein
MTTFHRRPPVSTRETQTYMSCKIGTRGSAFGARREKEGEETRLILVHPHGDGESGGGEEGHERSQRSIDESDGGDEKVIGVVDGEVELGRFGPL